MFNTSLVAPISFDAYYPDARTGAISRIADTSLRTADLYKRQQSWIGVYQYAQQHGLDNASLQDIITQLRRIQEQISFLQGTVTQANESYLRWQQDQNRKATEFFQSQGR